MTDTKDESAIDRMERFYVMWRTHVETGLPRTQEEADRIAASCGVEAPRVPRTIRLPGLPGRKKK